MVDAFGEWARGVEQNLDYFHSKLKADHDEAMRMQALAIGLQIGLAARRTSRLDDFSVLPLGEAQSLISQWARWAYREATGREWDGKTQHVDA